MNKQKFYEIFNNQYNQSLNKTTRDLDYKLTGQLDKCIHYTKTKTKKLKN